MNTVHSTAIWQGLREKLAQLAIPGQVPLTPEELNFLGPDSLDTWDLTETEGGNDE